MNRLRVAIVEDEIPAARLLRTLIARLRPAWEIEVLPGSVEEAVQWFAANRHPDLLFLDIQLADGTSFELLSQARPSSAVVFTTAYDEYAVRAFSVSSIDYILKPVDEERLAEAIARYEELRGRMLPPDDYLETLLDALQRREKRFRTRFLIAGADRFLTLPVEDVAYFYSENKVTTAVTFAGRNQCGGPPVEPSRGAARSRPLLPGQPPGAALGGGDRPPRALFQRKGFGDGAPAPQGADHRE